MRKNLIVAALFSAGLLVGWNAMAASKLTPAEAKEIARAGYIFGLPLVYIGVQADLQTNVSAPKGVQAPYNQFVNYREFPDAKNNKIVGMNLDTLYSLANLDLSAEPVVLVVPPMEGKRWWLMQVIDAWNDVPAAPGWRTHGDKGGNFALVGPNFKGTLPAGLERVPVDTSLALIGGRTYTGGKADLSAVHAIQDQYRLIPLSQWKGAATTYTPPASVPVKPGVDAATPVTTQVTGMSADQFFGRLSELLVNNPAREADAPIMRRLAKIGVMPGAKFTAAGFDDETRKAIDQGMAAARDDVRAEEAKMGEIVNGWQIARDLGRYKTKYLYRAAWTYFGVGGNRVEDAIYPLALVDSEKKPLNGANRYVLHFAKDQIPPADAFWSLTMYDKDSYLVDNPIGRYALGDRSNLKLGDDGSLTIYIQNDSPGPEKERNWLPSPKDAGFKMALRLYVPKKQVADGKWAPPAVQKAGT
ncbi:DUF1254 domain-containing protein [Variovorax sp. dw_308]|uniref:DUF1254 domain-containing protein n=1 Tax=Variovorax sp. dw_308 TaxID=2721546 RepID=UPI001C493FA7|nr:DUF1254 domain-containing protein [Variovorax sp. dw_308]